MVSASTRLEVDVAATPVELQAALTASPDAIAAAGLSLCSSLASALRRTALFPLSQVTPDTVTAQVYCGGAVPYGYVVSAPPAVRRRSLQDATACDPTDATALDEGICQLGGFDLSITVEDVVLAGDSSSADAYAAAVSAAMLDMQALHSETLAELATSSSSGEVDATAATGLLTAGSLTAPTVTVLTSGSDASSGAESPAAESPAESPSAVLPHEAIVGVAAGAAALVIVVVAAVLRARSRRTAVAESVAPRIVVVNPIQGPASPSDKFVLRWGAGGASNRTSFAPTSPTPNHGDSKHRIHGGSSLSMQRVNPLADNWRGARKTGEWT
jgi:hypothetical protein